MLADAMGFRRGANLGFRWLQSSRFQPVAIQPIVIHPIMIESIVIFLNDKSGGQQALKGLFVQDQIVPIRGHGVAGRETVQTGTIVVQFWAV